MASKKKPSKKTSKKVAKKVPKKPSRKVAKKKAPKKKASCHMDNHSGKPEWDKWLGHRFHWREPWEDDDGNHFRLDGEWEITSLHDDCETCWVSWVPDEEHDGDYSMEFPLAWVEGFDPDS